MDDERQLAERLIHGDRKAQRDFYDRYAGAAMAVALRYLADAERARDSVQEAFVNALTAVGRFQWRGAGSLRAWLMRIVVNESLMALRRSVRMETADELPDVPDEPEPDVGRVPLDVILRLIQRLPVGYRTVFNLYVFEKQSHRDIARALNISEGTSASQLLRARRLLARQINEYRKKQEQ